MVVISIIGILSAIGLTSFDAAQKKARDTIRKNDLRELKKALQAYYQDNGSYPIQSGWTSSEPGDLSPYSADYIPGLAPKYIAKLPRDPKGGDTPLCGSPWKRAYLYASDGNNYKVLSHCSPESVKAVNSSDPFADLRTYAFQVSSQGAAGW